MIKKIVFFVYLSLIIFNLDIICKNEIITYNMNDNFTIELPQNFKLIDTLGQKAINCKIENGIIIISYMDSNNVNNPSIDDEKDLIKFYNGLQSGFTSKLKGNLISENLFKKDNLLIKKFEYKTSFDIEYKVITCYLIYLNGYTYIIQLWQLDLKDSSLKVQCNNFFSSIKFSQKYDFSNQQNFTDQSIYYKSGYLFGEIVTVIIIFGILFYIFKVIKNRIFKKK